MLLTATINCKEIYNLSNFTSLNIAAVFKVSAVACTCKNSGANPRV